MKRNFTDEQFIDAVKTSITISEVLRKLGMAQGGNQRTVKRLVQELDLDTSHWLGNRHLLGRKRSIKPQIPTDKLLVDGHYHSTHKLKLRLIKENLLKGECYECGISDWQGHKLSLHLDHVNGKNTDNRLENLRLLCPNCHSITDTYCGRNSNKSGPNVCLDCGAKIPQRMTRCEKCNNYQPAKGTNLCVDCGNIVSRQAKRCQKCSISHGGTKIKWPSTQELIEMVNSSSYLEVGRQLGVCDNTVRKRIRKHPQP